MKPVMKKTLLWTPRIAGILFILFISLFALDVFDMNLSFWEIALGLFMHLLPSFALVIGVILAWRWEWVGALMFGGFSAWYVLSFRGFDWTVYALLVGVPLAIGLLFALGWVYRRQIRAT